MVLFHRACCVLATVTHRLVNASTGVFTWSKDHGATVRSVAPGPSSVYYVGGDRNNNIDATFATTRQLDSDGDPNWSVDHGATVWALRALAGGDVWSAGSTSSSVTHRRYNSSGTQQQTINATPFGGGVAVDPTSGRIWAYKSTGGSEVETVRSLYAYDDNGDWQYGIVNFTGAPFLEHDGAGNLYLGERISNTSAKVTKYTAGVQQWTTTITSTAGWVFDLSYCLDRATGDSYFSEDSGTTSRIRKIDNAGSEVALGGATSAPFELFGSTGRHMAAGDGYVYVRNPEDIWRYDTNGVYDAGWNYAASSVPNQFTNLELSPDGATLYVGRSNGKLAALDVAGPTVLWDVDAVGSSTNVSATDTLIVATGGGSPTIAAFDTSGALQWDDDDPAGTTGNPKVTSDAVYSLCANTGLAAHDRVITKRDHSGAVEWLRRPFRTGTGGAALSSNGTELAVLHSIVSYGAKVYEADGTLVDFYSEPVAAIEFDASGNVFIGTSSDIVKQHHSTYVRSWRAAFGTVDLAINSTGKVLAGLSTTFRQLTAAGASDWSKSVGGTVASVAYDASDNAWVAHSRSSSVTHRKYSSSGTALLTGDHTGNLTSIRCDSSNHPIIGGARV